MTTLADAIGRILLRQHRHDPVGAFAVAEVITDVVAAARAAHTDEAELGE